MWKILTAQIREEIYYSLISRELSPEEPKNAAMEQVEQENYYIVIDTFLRRAKRDEKT